MSVENKRMAQLVGSYADLDQSQMLAGELAFPSDHNPIYKDGAGNIKELLTGQSVGYLDNLIATMEETLTELEQLVIDRVGINDDVVSQLQGYSSYKIVNLLSEKQDTLTAGNNIDITDNTVSCTVINDSEFTLNNTLSAVKILQISSSTLNNNLFNLNISDWVANTDSATSSEYRYVATIASELFETISRPVWQLLPQSGITDSYTVQEASKVVTAVFDTTGITVYAKDIPMQNFIMNVKGAI